ncbi:MAG: tRNA (guanosine(37)-N1)-methyltransferase TrmD [Bdellovibrionia bacterium]
MVSSENRLQIHFLTLFPGMFDPILSASLLGKAQAQGLVSYHIHSIRDYALDKHRSVDEAPYGGGEGMLLKVDVLYRAWRAVLPNLPEPPVGGIGQPTSRSPDSRVRTVLLSPQGKVLTQSLAKELSQLSQLVLVCGHYEGVDQRFLDLCVDQEISIGDYVLTGGELPSMVLADCVTRLLPGVVGNEASVTQDSLEGGLLKYPQYTRPAQFHGLSVPPILMSGNHPAIASFREQEAQRVTRLKRPDLWEQFKKSR